MLEGNTSDKTQANDTRLLSSEPQNLNSALEFWFAMRG